MVKMDNPTPVALPEQNNGGNDFDDFMSSITTPRETIEAPPPLPGSEPAPDEPITDNDQANLNYFDYSPEHKQIAITSIYLIDMTFGFIGSIISGMPADRYKQFGDGKKPSNDFVDVTAALVKKHQVRLSLEAMFCTTLVAVYGPSMVAAIADRKKAAEDEDRQRHEDEITRRAEAIAKAKENAPK